jgi:BCD family chlorophyll transporter-like MFS transporter
MSSAAVWGHEKRLTDEEARALEAVHRPKLGESLRAIAAERPARLYFIFMIASMLFLFLQEAILSSFGGQAFHLSLSASANMQAMVTIGTIAGMVIAGRPIAEQIGQRRIAMIGLVGMGVSLAMLAFASAANAQPPVWLVLPLFGFTQGLFTVSTFALMMALSDPRRTALFMGAWTVARALAVGTADATSGGIFELGRSVFHSASRGYATVFAIEGIGLALCVPLLVLVYRVSHDRSDHIEAFEAGGFAAMAPEAALLAEQPD